VIEFASVPALGLALLGMLQDGVALRGVALASPIEHWSSPTNSTRATSGLNVTAVTDSGLEVFGDAADAIPLLVRVGNVVLAAGFVVMTMGILLGHWTVASLT